MKKLQTAAFLLAVPMMSALTLAAEEAHGAAEKPSLIAPIDQGLIVALTTLVIFVVLLVVLAKTAWGPIAKGLGEREAKIRRDLDEAEKARAAAVAAQKQYADQIAKANDEVRALLEKANADAQAVATRIKMQAQQEAEEAKERALKDIEASRKAAVAEIHEYAATLSTGIAEKILRRNLNADDQRELVRQSLEQLGSVN
ncbi:MAG: F0F1 ATP synthase subunit B [Tepidisphaeraceae bacterium]